MRRSVGGSTPGDTHLESVASLRADLKGFYSARQVSLQEVLNLCVGIQLI